MMSVYKTVRPDDESRTLNTWLQVLSFFFFFLIYCVLWKKSSKRAPVCFLFIEQQGLMATVGKQVSVQLEREGLDIEKQNRKKKNPKS